MASVKGRPTTRLPDLDLALTLPRRPPVTGCVLSMPRKGPGAVALSCWISCWSLSCPVIGTQGDPQGSPLLGVPQSVERARAYRAKLNWSDHCEIQTPCPDQAGHCSECACRRCFVCKQQLPTAKGVKKGLCLSGNPGSIIVISLRGDLVLSVAWKRLSDSLSFMTGPSTPARPPGRAKGVWAMATQTGCPWRCRLPPTPGAWHVRERRLPCWGGSQPS